MRLAVPALSVLLLTLVDSPPLAPQDPPRRPAVPAGGPGRIEGLVTDAEGAPLPAVAVTLRSAADSAVVTGVLTESGGRFRLEGLPLGGYLLHVGLIGYRSRSSEEIALTPDTPTRDLGVIELEVSAVGLEGLEVEVDRPAVVVEADRTVYEAGAMPVAATGTATDVLRAVPELEVDVNDNVKLRGNQSVAIHLNGRPAPLRGEQLANFLRQLPGNRIARVEVMPNPSARHDPEGVGGIVNIVLRDDLELGVSGSLSVNVSTRNRRFANGRLNLQRGRLTLFSGLGLNTYRDVATTYDLRENLVTDPVTLIEQDTRTNNRARGWNADWTLEVKVGERATLWSNAWMYSSSNGTSGTTAYGVFDEGRAPRDLYDRENDSDYTWGSYNFGYGFRQVFEPQQRELTIDGRITRGVNDTESRLTRLFHLLATEPVDLPLELTLNEIDAGNGNTSIQADYFLPVGGGRLETGYQAWRREQDNENEMLVFASPGAPAPREDVRSGYAYEEVFHSLYATWSRTVGKIGMQSGLRAERAETRFDSRVAGTEFERGYATLFPSFNVSYTPRQGRTLRLLYSKRINRPNPFYLDPFVPATDPLNVSVGNPDLRPSHVQSFTLDYGWTGRLGTLRAAPYYRHTTDVWERIRTVDTLGVATSRWENAASAKALGSSFTLSLRQSGPFSGSTTFSVYRDSRDGTNISSAYRRSAMMWSMGGNVAVKVGESLTAQMFANYFPTQSILQGRASGYTFTSLSVRQQVRATKGTVSLSVSDPLNLYRYTSSTRDATHVQSSRSSFRSRVATLGFTYNFGTPPQQQSRRTGPSEEAGETIRVR